MFSFVCKLFSMMIIFSFYFFRLKNVSSRGKNTFTQPTKESRGFSLTDGWSCWSRKVDGVEVSSLHTCGTSFPLMQLLLLSEPQTGAVENRDKGNVSEQAF